jgi:hypothetical protein
VGDAVRPCVRLAVEGLCVGLSDGPNLRWLKQSRIDGH